MESPWLLIIDNADDQQTPIENYFPEGERGCILVTTRNPALKVHGTHGSRYHLFKELGEGEANDLLLRAADEPRPWSVLSQQSATPITKALGFLPLALVHAGKAILNKLCTLQNYLNFYERNWNRIRKSRSRSSSQSDHDTYSIIYSSYEIMYHGLEERESQAANDALDLLKMFSFFHRENIRIDILRLAATNPRLEKREQARKSQEEKRDRRKPISMSWSQSMRSIGLGVYLFLMNLGSCPVLPKVLRDAEELELFDEFRLRDALKELHQMSLITYNDANDGYSMHPLIHTWVRERPEMSTAEQASWCHAAATTLAQAILLPPLGSTEADEDLRRDLLPHIDHVQRCQHALRERIQDNQLRRRRLWPPLQPQLDRLQALQLAKFSLVYAQCGLWNEAEKLQLKVSEFVSQMLGMEHPSTMDIMLALSGTYWQLGRGNEAADLQQRVLDACINFRGEDDLKTLKVMDTLGVSRWQQARFKEARFLHERAINGLTKLQGADHVDTLIATGNLGRIHAKNCAYEEAIKVLTRAVAGLRAKLGISHLDTLIALDNLAMSYLDRAMFQDWSSEDVDQAHRLMLEVVEQRKTKLGKEHPYTLWAVCNLARVKSAQGDHTEAVSLMRGGIVIAERNLGETHIGTLFGKLYLGNALVSANKLDEAEKTLVHVSEAYKMSSREHHPDRLIALSFLVRCYTLQDRAAEVANLRDQIVEGLDRLGGRGHPMEQQLLHPRTELGRNSAAARTAIFPHNADLTLRKQSAEKSIGVKYPEDIVIPSIASRRTF
jgi:tetratricopeptide (TPR) repeat protein